MIANFPPLPHGMDNVIASKVLCNSEKHDPSGGPPHNLKASSNFPATNANSSDSVHETSMNTGAVNEIASSNAIASNAGKESPPKCSWSISSKGCLMQGVQPKDVCGVDGWDSDFHHMCQTEWEMYQYYVEFPVGNPKYCIYDSDGKKQYIHHHPHSKLALLPIMQSMKEGGAPDKLLSTTQLLYEGTKSHPMTGDEKQEGPSNPSQSSVESSKK